MKVTATTKRHLEVLRSLENRTDAAALVVRNLLRSMIREDNQPAGAVPADNEEE